MIDPSAPPSAQVVELLIRQETYEFFRALGFLNDQPYEVYMVEALETFRAYLEGAGAEDGLIDPVRELNDTLAVWKRTRKLN